MRRIRKRKIIFRSYRLWVIGYELWAKGYRLGLGLEFGLEFGLELGIAQRGVTGVGRFRDMGWFIRHST